MDNWNNILKRNKEYIKAKNKIKTQVENNRLQQPGLTENLQTLFQPILKSQEDIKKKLALEYRAPIEPTPSIEPHHPEPNQYDSILFSNVYPLFEIDKKDFIFTTTEGLIDLMNGGDIEIAKRKDLVEYLKFLYMIKNKRKTKRLMAVETYLNIIKLFLMKRNQMIMQKIIHQSRKK
ncbi:hypothetical protein LOTGIDRAFT_157199 [Lottia gigantea]|uniref:Uncharacterized protein n=1 Tax=Lottia gigantea TaxID=225164 RepID=V4AWZ6_LOTGI|nr:hypothetical protein LOTGIDRAFT_157199 [Lottia gigantea]ESP02058.1 hypothetical protein LOTGIDRAFT_157199 [Lottia gigantea]